MTIQHLAIVDAERHQPKGLTTAAVGTCYFCTGVDTGAWSLVATSNITDLNVTTAKLAAQAVTTAKIADASVTQAQQKTKAIIALVDTVTTLTGAQLIDSGIFTAVPTVARIQTVDNATNIIAAMPRAQVGSWSDFSMTVTAAFDETIATNTGITLIGNMVVNNSSATFKILITNIGTPAVTILRQD